MTIDYAPTPTRSQLATLASALGSHAELTHVRRFKGGLGCTMDVLELREPGGHARTLNLRRYGVWHDDRNLSVITRETTALKLAATGGIPVPELVWIDEADVFAEQAILLTYIEGETVLIPGDPIDWADQLATMATRIHAVPVDAQSRSVILDITAQCEQWRLQQEPPKRFTDHPMGTRMWEKRRQLLGSDPPVEPALVHNDAWPGNIIWRDGRIAAVIDWEDTGYGDPIADVAYCANDMRYAGLEDAADHFIARYAELSGRTLETLQLWTVVALTRPLPDIARWLPSWQDMGHPDMTADRLRAIYDDLIERALAEW